MDQGECVPRLCADNFIYVETDQMCHDVNEPGICPGNRRLYLTAYGTAVCDCMEGTYAYHLHASKRLLPMLLTMLVDTYLNSKKIFLSPGMFPGPNNTCYFLYESAYCAVGSVLQFDRATKTLTCKPDPCSYVNSKLWPDDLPYAPRPKDGYCYQFNEVVITPNFFFYLLQYVNEQLLL